MSTVNYVPRNDKAFLAWAKNVITYARHHAARLKILEPPVELTGIADEFAAKLEKMDDPNHGKIDTVAKNEYRKMFEKQMRAYVQGSLAKNPNVTAVDKESMALPVYDTNPTPVGEPLGQAMATVAYRGGQTLQLDIKHVSGTPFDKKANYGCKIYYGAFDINDTQPANGEDLTKNRFTRRKREIFEFAPADIRKTAYFAIRYENSKGKAGAWGPMIAAVIP